MKSKELKRQEARERQQRYNALTPIEKHALMAARPGTSTRERQRVSDSTNPPGGLVQHPPS